MARKSTGRWIVANGCVTSSKTGRSILALSADKFVLTTPHTSECVEVDAAGIAALKLDRPAKLAIAAMFVKVAPKAKAPVSELSALKRDRGLARARQNVAHLGPKAKADAKKAERALTRKINALEKVSA